MKKIVSTQTKQNEHPEKVPASIYFGRVLLLISSAFLIIAAGFEVLTFAYNVMNPNIDWSDVLTLLDKGSGPVMALFLLFCSIGGISYVLDMGPFVGLCPLCALICVIIVIVDFISSTRTLIMVEPHDIWAWFSSLISTQLISGLYAIGWMLAKNWLD